MVGRSMYPGLRVTLTAFGLPSLNARMHCDNIVNANGNVIRKLHPISQAPELLSDLEASTFVVANRRNENAFVIDGITFGLGGMITP
ncbi:MAG: hypothetical protein OXB95_10605 [Rhodobacteraceae bacterium]|nr:hypothetical protein [Paracoccaceae bacterium]